MRRDAARVALTGATGYVGGRLLLALEGAGIPVRCLARRPEYLRDRVGPGTEVVAADCLDADTLPPALAGADVAVYLVHSMGATGDFAAQDVRAARQFGEAARAAGVARIVYLGGLGDDRAPLSDHLRSRHDTGEALRASGVPVIELRASIILGSGSLSFELIRALVERLPVMLCPRWVWTQAQPIAIEDVIAYLMAAIARPVTRSEIFEIGGAEVVAYADIMREYAKQRGLRRLLVSVPVLTPRLSSLWLGLTTPVYARVGRKLVESLRNPTVVVDHAARETFPIRPMGLRESIRRALVKEDREFASTHWSDAISATGVVPSWGGVRFGGRLIDTRVAHVPVAPAAAFAPIRRLGGRAGWYYGDWLWQIRGFLDLLLGGVGMRRGRRDPDSLRPGDPLDFWRVETIEPDRRLRLAAEMKVPGRAWLEFAVEPDATGCQIRQTAIFDPAGLLGLLYWYAIYPLHARVFRGLLRGIVERAVAADALPEPGRRRTSTACPSSSPLPPASPLPASRPSSSTSSSAG